MITIFRARDHMMHTCMAAETENAQPSPPLANGMSELAIITLPTNIITE